MNLELNKNLAQLAALFVKKKLTLSTAESCTSGLLQNIFSLADNAMMFFQGGMTVYNTGQKAKQLNINPILAEQCNAVSKDIAEKMALEIAHKFNSEVGISITGYAQAVPDDGIDACFAFIAITMNGKVAVSKKIKGELNLSLASNQQIYAEKIIKELLNLVK